MKKAALFLVIVLLLALSVGAALWSLEDGLRLPVSLDGGHEAAENPAPPAPAEPAPSLPHPADAMLGEMDLAQKVGQLFFARCPAESALGQIRSLHPAGFVLFSRDFEDETSGSVQETIADYQNAARIPMLIGVDEEGGTVVRVSRYPAFRRWPFQSPQQLYHEGGLEAIAQDTAEKNRLLLGLGINVNLAPVCDISQSEDDYMHDRTLGAGPEETAAYVQTVVGGMARDGIGAVLKHFPGYGAAGDTHTDSIADYRSLQTLERQDFVPFRAGIEAGAGAVLVSHLTLHALGEGVPASLSPRVNRILREGLNFAGVIMTDDLSMDAIEGYAESGEAAVLAVLAGSDLIITSDFETQHAAVLHAVETGRLTLDELDTRIRRVLDWKAALGLAVYKNGVHTPVEEMT